VARSGRDVAAEALDDALRRAGDDRLDFFQFLQRHAVVGDGVVVERSAAGLDAVIDAHGHEQRGGDAGWAAAGLGRRVPYVQQTGFVVGGVGRVRQPAVVEPPGADERGRGRAAEPDRRPAGPERPGRRRDAVEFQDLPVEGGSAAPQLAPQRDRLVQAGETAFPRHLGQRVERLSEPAGEARADRDHEPAARQQIDRGQGLGGLDRPAQEGQQRAGAQRGPLCYRGERGQHRECLDARADQGVVDEERGETQLFGPDAEGD
jgi:hypothetical protein